MTIKYDPSGLWVEQLEDSYRIGISEKGQDDTGEIMFVDLPDFGEAVSKEESLFSVEGAKSVSEIVSPFDGKIKAVHKEIEDDPDLLNSTDPSKNWIIELTDVKEEQFQNLKDVAWETN